MRDYDAARSEKRRQEKRKDPSEYASNYRVPPVTPARVPDCHPDRKHYGHGFCHACYQRAKRDGRLPATPAKCHPDKPALAKGLCHQCYAAKKYWNDPEKHKQMARDSHAAARKKLRDELVEAYGGVCACKNCPETNPAFLTLEHVNGDGRQHRAKVGSHSYADLRRRGWPQEGYTLLCWNCNAMTRGGRACPHEQKE
jgi:hypothetical protein